MTNDLARWQFATTSIYHFLFVPVTIGLAFLVALLQTAWYRNDKPEYKRLAKFFGTLLVINVAVGVVTGLVQEFEFGMNWSAYSRFVGDVFGAPLAMEGLAAFFLESTFLGLWLFGWGRLPKRVHLACIWLVAIGTHALGAVHPGRQLVDAAPGRLRAQQPRPARTEQRLGAVHQPDVPLGLRARDPGLAGHRLARDARGLGVVSAQSSARSSCFATRRALSVIVLLPVIVLQMFVGNKLGEIETKYQPMKIAAAEAQWENCQPCSFSAFQIGGGNNDKTPTQIIEIPHLLSILATGHLERRGRRA